MEVKGDDGDKKEHCVSSKHLETEIGDSVTDKDLYFENTVIWKHAGKPYEATILDVHSK